MVVLMMMCIACANSVKADPYDDISGATKGSVHCIPKPTNAQPADTRLIDTAVDDVQKRERNDNAQALSDAAAFRANTPLQAMKRRIESTRTIGRHLNLAYDANSLAKMTKLFSAKDVPAMLALYSADTESSAGVQFALASQCRAGVEELLKAVHAKTFRKPNQRLTNILDAKDIIEMVSKSAQCDATTRQHALNQLKTLQ